MFGFRDFFTNSFRRNSASCIHFTEQGAAISEKKVQVDNCINDEKPAAQQVQSIDITQPVISLHDTEKNVLA